MIIMYCPDKSETTSQVLTKLDAEQCEQLMEIYEALRDATSEISSRIGKF